jgi:hydrogenase-1 operon protein HyaE
MTHPLIQRLYDDYGYPEVTLQTHDDFISQPGIAVLFFAGDPKLFRDTTDIAVVLPELVQAFDGALHPGVVADVDGKALQQHYGFAAWPSLVFLRDGGYLGCLTGIQNWSEYLQAISDLVVADVQQPQGLGIPVVSA